MNPIENAKNHAARAACEAYMATLDRYLKSAISARDMVDELHKTGHDHMALVLLDGTPLLMRATFEWNADPEMIAQAVSAKKAGDG